MDWKLLISSLMAAGVSQKEIGCEIGLSQAAVSDLYRGRTSRVEWSAGQRLIALHSKRSGAPAVHAADSAKTMEAA